MNRPFDLDEMAERLRSERNVWVRYVIDEGGEIRALEISIAHEPPSWSHVYWRYSQAKFESQVTAGSDVATWIGGGDAATLPHANFGSLSWPANYERHPSGMITQSETLDWPVDQWRAAFTSQLNAIPGELVPLDHGGGPTFRSFDLAAANLLGLVRRTGWTAPGPELVVRRQDRSARITSVFLELDGAVDVVVDGDRLQGATLELAGEVPGRSYELGAAPRQELHFDGPLPELAWLALHRDGVLLDTRRRLERPLHGGEAEMGVTWERERAPTDNSPFTLEEQAEIQTRIAAIEVTLRAQIGDGEEADRLDEILDRLGEATKRLGRIDWREKAAWLLVESVGRGLLTMRNARLAWTLLTAGIRAVTGVDLPELPSAP